MHDWEIPPTLKAVGRAGAGVNNIPVDKMTARGIPVFNAPGANANAVKELVLASVLIASRNLFRAWDYARKLQGTDAEISKQVESGKKQFVGSELVDRTLGVIGLGAIGVKVANAAQALGMKVVGFDPHITVKNAWQLSSYVKQATSVEDVLSQSEFVTLHVPLSDTTRNTINADRLVAARKGLIILNFSRGGIIDDQAVCDALKAGKVKSYISDFASNLLLQQEQVIVLPHLGASTEEAEENCAIMVADQVRDYLEDGSVCNSVNFPEVQMPRTENAHRLLIVNANVPGMIERISTAVAKSKLNIVNMLSKSRGEIACTLMDVACQPPQTTVEEIKATEGVLTVQTL
jgi:D-3-phosphoglycerate dehydrogenase